MRRARHGLEGAYEWLCVGMGDVEGGDPGHLWIWDALLSPPQPWGVGSSSVRTLTRMDGHYSYNQY